MNDILLKTEHLSYTYEGENAPALKDVSLSIRRGSKVAVMGANGSGKSTFFLCCNGILKPASGQLFYDGVPYSYKKKDLLSLRSRVGIVFQNPDNQLFSASVYEEISFGLCNLGVPEDEAARRVKAAMEHLDITPFSHKPVHALSGGQKKQVALSDVLVMEPEILILDEPSAALDPKHTRLIRAFINQLSDDGMTILISTHDVDYALEWADELILLKDGEVLAQGNPADILNDRTLTAAASLETPRVLSVYECLLKNGMFGSSLLTSYSRPRSFEELERIIAQNGRARSL